MRMTGGVNWRSFAPDYELDVNRKSWALSLKWRRTNLLLYLTILSIVGGIVPTVLLFDEIVELFDRLVGPDVGSNAGLIVTLIIIVLVSGGLLVFGFGGLRWRLTIRIDDGQVTVRERLYWRWSGFSEPLTNYRGVESRSERYFARGDGKYTLQFIELVHADPTRTVPLLRREQEDFPRSEWEAYAKAFGLPTLHLDSGEVRKRELADLDKSLKELDREGKVARKKGEIGPAPRFIKLIEKNNLIEIRMPGQSLLRRRYILIHHDRIEAYSAVLSLGHWGHQTIFHDDIESITVEGKDTIVKALVISGDTETITLVTNISVSKLEWLRDYITEAVLTA